MGSSALDAKADLLIQKIRHFLITNSGKIECEASLKEFYRAFCVALREEIMINWTANLHSIDNSKARTVYYLSMEYLPGRFLHNNLVNIGGEELLKAVVTKCGRNMQELLSCEADPGLGNGGLGRLASCFLDSLATHHYPAWGYGLRYQYGIFDQEIWNGEQVERPDTWLLDENPWEFRKDLHAVSVHFRGTPVAATNSHGEEIYQLDDYEEVRAIPFDIPIVGYSNELDFSVISMRLWTTKESPRNFQLQRYNAGQLDQAGENTSLTDVLYPNDHHETGKRIRLKQEFLLVSASLQDIIRHHLKIYGDISSLPEKVQIQINDTHPALIIAELIRRLTKDFDLPWDRAVEITSACCNYTNHTILKESLEEWNEKRLYYLLPRQYNIIQRFNDELCRKIRKQFPGDEEKVRSLSIIENGQIRMAHLAIVGCKKVNGVAALHSQILKDQLFNDFAKMYPEKFVNVTNGVTPRRWLLMCNPRLAEFITERIGHEWIYNFVQIEKLAEFAKDHASQEAFMAIKRANKKDLIDFMAKENPLRDSKGKIIDHSSVLDETALIDMHIKRFHEYKRQLMNALHAIMLFNEIKENPASRQIKRQIIFGGKSAPGYQVAKEIIQLIYCIARKINQDPEVSQKLKVAFVENYNVSKAELLIPAADLSEQISTAGMEASGTGNMKLAMNGAMTIGTEDGANIEMREAVGNEWWPFSFGCTKADLSNQGEYKAWDIYIGNPAIQKAVYMLKDGSLIKSEGEHNSLSHLYETLLSDQYDCKADRFFVLKDLQAFYDTQKKVEELYLQPNKWAEFAIHNIAGMGRFSSDEVINNYAQSIWNLEPAPINADIIDRIRTEYSENIGF